MFSNKNYKKFFCRLAFHKSTLTLKIRVQNWLFNCWHENKLHTWLATENKTHNSKGLIQAISERRV